MYPVTIGPVVDIQFQLGVQDSVAALPPSSAFSQFAVQRPNVTSITPNRCLHAGRYRARHGIIGVLFQLDFLFLCVYEHVRLRRKYECRQCSIGGGGVLW